MKYRLLLLVLTLAPLFAFADYNETNGNKKSTALLPTATITGTATVCQNAPSPLITFTGSGGTAPYTFTYTVTGTPGNQTVVTTSGNSVTVQASSSIVGVFTYSLVSVKDNTNATQNQTGTAIITVNAPPTVDFTFTNNNTCSGTNIQFTSSVVGTGVYTYSWDFGDSTAVSTQVNPSHSFTSLGCGTASFTVTLTVTGGGCTVVKTHTITVKQKPDFDFTDSNHPADPFSNCIGASINPNFTVILQNIPPTSSCITSYSVNWGDSSPVVNNAVFPLTHSYNLLGVFNITITATGSNGCINIKTYQVKNISSPGGGLSMPLNVQNICAPTPNIDIAISGWGTNSLDTTYSINYGDSTTPITLTQNQLVSSSYFNSSNPASSSAYPIPHSFASASCPTYYTITLNISNACNANPPQTATIYVISKPVANFTAPLKACDGTNVLFTNTTTSGYGNNCVQGTTSYVWDFGDPASGASNIINTGYITTIPNANHVFSGPGTYTITLTAQNAACGTSVKTQQICIEEPLTPQFSIVATPLTGCSPVSVTVTNTTNTANSCPTPTVTWEVTFSPSSCGVNISPIPIQTTDIATYNFTEPGSYTIKLTMVNSCGTTNTSQTVTVKKPPTVALGNIANFCQGATVTPTATVNGCTPNTSGLTYAWSFPGGTPSSSTSPTPPAVSYASTGNYSITLAVTNECGTTTATSTTFTVQSAAIVQNETTSVCSGTPFSITPSNTTSGNIIPAGTTYTWSTPTVTGGMTGGAAGTNQTSISGTLINTTNTAQTATYIVTPKTGICNGTPFTVTVTVNPAPVNTTPLVSSVVCLGGAPTVLSVALNSTTGNPTYQWYSNTTNSNTGGVLLSSETNSTFSPPSTTLGILYYYCVITLSSGGCANFSSNVASVTVNPQPTITTQPNPTQSVCTGTAPPTALTVAYSGGVGTGSYQWYSNATNSTSGGNLITGATNATYSPPAVGTAGTYYFYVIITLSGNGCNSITSNVAEIQVFADPTITAQPLASQTLCQGATPTQLSVTATGGNGAFTYQWYSNINNNTTSGILLPGANSPTYTPVTTNVGTLHYYCVISQSTVGCSVTSATATVIIETSPSITSQPPSSTVCLGGTPTPLAFTFANGQGSVSYQWYSNTFNNTTSGTLLNLETNPTYAPLATAVGTMYYYCQITFSGITGACATIVTNTAEIIVTPSATINQQPQTTQSICVGTNLPTPLTVSYIDGTGSPTYQWYSNTVNSTTGGTLLNNTNNPTYNPPVFTLAGTFYYYTTITFSGSGCGALTSDVAEVIVVVDPIVSVQPLVVQNLCQNEMPTPLAVNVTGGIGTNYAYQWYVSTSNNTSSGTAISGATNSSYSPPTNATGTLYYYCIITQPNGPGCSVTSDVATINVSTAPTINNQPLSSIVCLGQAATTMAFTVNNGVGTPSYQWYSNTTNSTIGATLIASETNPTFSPPTTTVGIVYYFCQVSFPTIVGACSVITTNPAEVIVNQTPVIASITDVICSGNSFVVNPTNTGSNIIPIGTTYTWTQPTIVPLGSVTGASAELIPQNTISQTLTNTTTSPATVTYTVTPTSGSCTGSTFTVIVTVNPSITANEVIVNSTCFGSNNASITTNIVGGIPFSSGAPYQIAWTGPNGYTSALPSISGLSPGVYNLTVTDNGGCPFSVNYTVTEPTALQITIDSETDITCFGSANGSISTSVTGGTGSYTYTWTLNSAPYIASTDDITNLSPGTYILSVTDVNNCGPATASFSITEPSVLAVSLLNQVNVGCFGANTGSITINPTGGTPIQVTPGVFDYTYAWTGPNGFVSSNQNLSSLFAGTYDLIITDNLGCQDNLTVTLTEPTEIQINAVTTPIECYGDNDATIAVTLSGGNPPYSTSWSNLAVGLNQSNLSAGDYTITVTDGIGCVKQLTITIPEAPLFDINPVVTNISCFGANDGSIVLNFVGGIAPVNLVWSDSSTAGTTRNNLGPGTYSVTITDGKPCTINATFVIVEPQPLVLSAVTVNALDCNDANSGSINLLVSGGTPPFNYSWSNGAIVEDLNAIPAGNYLITVTDSRGCTKNAQYVITRPDPIVISVATTTQANCGLFTIEQVFTAQVTGGVPPFQYNWSSGTVSGSNNQIMTTNQSGLVILNIVDALGCSPPDYTFNVQIPAYSNADFEYTSIGYVSLGILSIQDPIQFTTMATGPFDSILWDFGDGTFSNETNPTHTYLIEGSYVVTQTVTYPFGCVYTNVYTLDITKGYLLVVPNAFTPNGDAINSTFRPVTKALNEVRLDVYDTWGSLIYSEIGDVLVGWDGTIKGIEAENGNYYCKVSAKTFYGVTVNENHPFVLIK